MVLTDEKEAEAAGTVRKPEPFILVIFGASGDLTRRKLLPAIFNLYRDGLLPEEFAVLGYARSENTDEGFREAMRAGVEEFGRRGLGDQERWQGFASRLHYLRGAYDDPQGYAALGKRLQELSGDVPPGNCLFYLATPPVAFVPVVAGLRESGLARRGRREAPWSRVVVEKPFGRDLQSARDLNGRLGAAFTERQVFRIDHYLGKETVQNLMVLRFANTIFEPVWNQNFVDHVQVTVSETIGVEGRGAYYDETGAARDMVQNHIMQLVSLVAMEPPLTLRADAVRDEKIKVLRALRPAERPRTPGNVVRARYTAGRVGDRDVPGYLDEEGVDPDSATETFVAMKVCVDNWRWSGTPFYLRTGKRLPARVSEIGVHFRPIPRVLFNAPPGPPIRPNVLSVRIQPNAGISMRLQVKVPGPAMRLEPYQMDFGYAEAFRREPPEAYERLLLDAAIGDATLFTRSDEVEAAWAFLEPLLEVCRDRPDRKPVTYPAGSWGPDEADDLLAADGREWTLLKRPNEGDEAEDKSDESGREGSRS